MSRTNAREIAVQLIYSSAVCGRSSQSLSNELLEDKNHFETLSSECEAYEKYPDANDADYIARLLKLYDDHKEDIDGLIEKYAQGWRLARISKTAAAVLRCAVCEIMYMDDVPAAAAINEAVELSKGYDDADTVAFINGVLGGLMRGEFPADDSETETSP